MRACFSFLILIISASTSFAQYPNKDSVAKYSIPIDNIPEPNNQVYDKVKGYQVILIGEMHGTAEPAQWLEGIAKGLLQHGKQVIIGIEIPAGSMRPFMEKRGKEGISASPFFTAPNTDGRHSQAWGNLLLAFADSKVQFVFFDVNENQQALNRDSIMAENISKALKTNPNAVFVGLCGNIHNMVSKYHEANTMACFLKNKGIKLLSLRHFYSSGSLYNNTGNGVGPKTVNESGSPFAQFAIAENYLLIGYPMLDGQYDGVIYSDKVTASGTWEK